MVVYVLGVIVRRKNGSYDDEVAGVYSLSTKARLASHRKVQGEIVWEGTGIIDPQDVYYRGAPVASMYIIPYNLDDVKENWE